MNPILPKKSVGFFIFKIYFTKHLLCIILINTFVSALVIKPVLLKVCKMKKSNVNEIEKAWNKVAEARGLLETARDMVENILNEEQEIFDGRSEKWQEGEKGEEAQDLLNNLESILEALNNAYDNDTDEAVSMMCDIVENN